MASFSAAMPKETSAQASLHRGYIKGIIGLPANLFYGTGIPACIVVVDKEAGSSPQGSLHVDASGGFMKDGPKNRLRAQDIHKIVDVFSRQTATSRLCSDGADRGDREATSSISICRAISMVRRLKTFKISRAICGAAFRTPMSMPSRRIGSMPEVRRALFRANRPGYLDLAVDKAAIKPTIYDHPEFAAFVRGMNAHFRPGGNAAQRC